MIVYEIQLQYVIQDQIQSETKSSPRQNSIWEKNWRKDFIAKKENCWKKIVSDFVSDWQCSKWVVSDKLMLIITKWCKNCATKEAVLSKLRSWQWTLLYSKTCLLWPLYLAATCPLWPMFTTYSPSNFMHLMFNRPIFWKTTCFLRPIFIENLSDHSKQVVLY